MKTELTTLDTTRIDDTRIAAVRALDRLLLSGFYVVPLYHQPEQWVARWKHLQHADKVPVYGYQLPTWWRQDG